VLCLTEKLAPSTKAPAPLPPARLPVKVLPLIVIVGDENVLSTMYTAPPLIVAVLWVKVLVRSEGSEVPVMSMAPPNPSEELWPFWKVSDWIVVVATSWPARIGCSSVPPLKPMPGPEPWRVICRGGRRNDMLLHVSVKVTTSPELDASRAACNPAQLVVAASATRGGAISATTGARAMTSPAMTTTDNRRIELPPCTPCEQPDASARRRPCAGLPGPSRDRAVCRAPRGRNRGRSYGTVGPLLLPATPARPRGVDPGVHRHGRPQQRRGERVLQQLLLAGDGVAARLRPLARPLPVARRRHRHRGLQGRRRDRQPRHQGSRGATPHRSEALAPRDRHPEPVRPRRRERLARQAGRLCHRPIRPEV